MWMYWLECELVGKFSCSWAGNAGVLRYVTLAFYADLLKLLAVDKHEILIYPAESEYVIPDVSNILRALWSTFLDQRKNKCILLTTLIILLCRQLLASPHTVNFYTGQSMTPNYSNDRMWRTAFPFGLFHIILQARMGIQTVGNSR